MKISPHNHRPYSSLGLHQLDVAHESKAVKCQAVSAAREFSESGKEKGWRRGGTWLQHLKSQLPTFSALTVEPPHPVHGCFWQRCTKAHNLWVSQTGANESGVTLFAHTSSNEQFPRVQLPEVMFVCLLLIKLWISVTDELWGCVCVWGVKSHDMWLSGTTCHHEYAQWWTVKLEFQAPLAA